MREYKKYLMALGIVWAASTVLLGLFFYFVVSPQLAVKKQLNERSDQAKKKYELAIVAAQEESKNKLAEEVAALKAKLGDYIVEFEDSTNLTFDISRIAAEKQVDSFTVKTTDGSKSQDQLNSKNLQENRIDISFSSDYRKFASFLNALERHSPVIFVDRFKLTRGDPTSHKVDMDLSIFVKKREKG